MRGVDGAAFIEVVARDRGILDGFDDSELPWFLVEFDASIVSLLIMKALGGRDVHIANLGTHATVNRHRQMRYKLSFEDTADQWIRFLLRSNSKREPVIFQIRHADEFDRA